jgi:hypothetical protein
MDFLQIIANQQQASARRARRRKLIWLGVAAVIALFVTCYLVIHLTRQDKQEIPLQNARAFVERLRHSQVEIPWSDVVRFDVLPGFPRKYVIPVFELEAPRWSSERRFVVLLARHEPDRAGGQYVYEFTRAAINRAGRWSPLKSEEEFNLTFAMGTNEDRIFVNCRDIEKRRVFWFQAKPPIPNTSSWNDFAVSVDELSFVDLIVVEKPK